MASACGAGNVCTLELGDCFDDWEGATNLETEDITDVPIVECAEPHDNEIYLMENLPDGDFLGDTALREAAIATCHEGFDTFVGTPYEKSSLDFGWFFPTSKSWAEGDRQITCFVYDFEFAKLTGSMAGAGV